MARARGANATLAGVFESSYGTTPGSGFKALPFVSSNLGEEKGLIPSDLLGYGRNVLDPSEDVSNDTGDLVVPVDLRAFGFWLKLAFGAPTTTEDDGVYTHVFKSGAANLPSASLQIGMPDVPSFGMNKGVKLDRMTVAMARSGLLNATLALIAQGETRATTTGAGTPTTYEITRFPQAKGEIKRDGVQLASITGAEFTVMNDLEPVEDIRPSGQIGGADEGQAGFSANITSRFASTALLDQAIAGDPCELSFGWSLAADSSLLVEVPRVFLPRAKVPISGPRGIQTTFAVQAATDATEGAAVVVTLVNDVASY